MRRLLLALLLSTLAVSANAADLDVPATFLPPANDANGRALQKPVSGKFHAEPARTVFDSLFRQLPANFVFSSHRPMEPTFTGNFDNIPFRTAIYLVAKSTAFKIEWTTGSHGSRLISIHD